MDVQKIGMLIAELRKEKNMTQKELADRLRVSDRAVSKWERGLNLPNAELFEPLCDELGINVMELLRGEKNSAEQIPVAEAEKTIADVTEIAKEKDKKVRKLRCVLVPVICLLVVLSVILVYKEIRQRQYDKDTVIPGVIITYHANVGSIRMTPYMCGFRVLNRSGEVEEGGLAVTRPEGNADTIVKPLDMWGGSNLLGFSILGEKREMTVEVFRWPAKLRGSDAGMEDGEPVEYILSPTEEYANRNVFTIEPDYVYSIVISWGDDYFAEYAFQTVKRQN